MSVLSDHFVENIKEVLLQLTDGYHLKESFLQETDPETLNNHLYKRVLILRSYLDEEDIEPEVAEKLVKTDLVDCVFVGTESDGYNNDLDEDWTKDDLTFMEQCKLWI